MGNYYSGDLCFRFNKKIGDTLYNDMKVLVNKNYDDKNISDLSEVMRNAKWLTHPRAFYPQFTIYNIYNINGEQMTFLSVDGNQEDNLSEEERRIEEKLKEYPLIGYELEVSFCMKRYLEEFDLGKAIVEFFKPYLDKNLYGDNHGGFIGNINDEDCTYDEDFFIEKVSHSISEERKPICNGCVLEAQSATCDNYCFCCRAYNIGKRAGETSLIE